MYIIDNDDYWIRVERLEQGFGLYFCDMNEMFQQFEVETAEDVYEALVGYHVSDYDKIKLKELLRDD